MTDIHTPPTTESPTTAAADTSAGRVVKPDVGLDDVVKSDLVKSDADWKRELSPQQYQVLRKAGTEPPFTGKYTYAKETGTYRCGACGNELFDSSAKYDSGSGWPSFYEPKVAEAVELVQDRSHGTVRTEVRCRRCGSHLGHVFDDGPAPTGQRYCMNSLALDLDQTS